MKDSGVEWIGEIPESWEISKVRRGFRVSKTIAGDKANELPRLSLSNAGVLERPKYDGFGESPADYATYQIIPVGQFVFNFMGLEQDSLYRRVGISPMTGLVSAGYMEADYISTQINPEYAYYFFRFMENGLLFKQYGSGIRSNLNKQQFHNMPLLFPPLDEQARISAVIKHKVEAIDTIISETQQSIDELKKYKQALITETVTKGLDKNVEMKDSGIDILPSIPTSWKIQKIKNLFSMNKGLSITKENLEDNGIPVISYGEIHSKYGFNFDPTKDFVRNVPESFVQSDKQAILHKGDFVFADTSEDIEGSGNFTCFTGNVTTFAGYHTVILKAKANFNHQYVAYLFDSKIFRSQIQKNVQGIKVFNITQRILKDQWIWLPPIEVQENIVSFLDKKRIIINQMIDNKIAELMELESYKKALIYEYVTGKKEA